MLLFNQKIAVQGYFFNQRKKIVKIKRIQKKKKK